MEASEKEHKKCSTQGGGDRPERKKRKARFMYQTE